MTDSSDTHDIIVVGAGPAGRGVTHRAVRRGLDVVVVDPRPNGRWVATLAGWTDELPSWLDPDAVAAQVDSIQMKSADVVDIRRGYTVLHTDALQRSLSLDGAQVIGERAVTVGEQQVTTTSGRSLTAPVVVDARGTTGSGARQTAWGVIVPTAQAAPVLDGADAILMDWSSHGLDDADVAPSFLYVVPLDDERVLLEETCLAGNPPIPVRALRSRLEHRLGHLSLTPLDTETVSFALRGVTDRPWRGDAVLFGARGDLMHPATGYSVATSLRVADDVLDAVAAGRDPRSMLWPPGARAVQHLRLVGVRALLSLDPDQVRRFFGVFATMPIAHQRAYLSGRDDLRGTAAAMTWLFAHVDGSIRRALIAATIGMGGPQHPAD